LPVARTPQRGDVIARVWTARSGVEKSSTPSRKNGRFSGNESANRSLAEICAVSLSTCEKSGLTVKSSALSAFGRPFHVDANIAVDAVRGERRSWPIDRGARAPRADVRRRHEMTARRQVREADQRVGTADEAVATTRELCREDRVAEVTRVISEEQNAQVWGSPLR